MNAKMLAAGLLILSAAASQATERTAPPPPIGAEENGLFFVNYPATSLKRNEQGVVHYQTSVDRKGLPLDCLVTKSSGHERLDQVTCAAVVNHARFKAAINDSGMPIRSVYNGKVTWRTR